MLKLPTNYVGLTLLAGSTAAAPDQACVYAFNESILIGGGVGMHVYATGARIRLRNCLAVTAGDGFLVQPQPKCPSRLNLHLLLEQNTLASKQAQVRLGDVKNLDIVNEPVSVQARGNAFINPFTDAEHRAGLTAFEQSLEENNLVKNSLGRGMFCWQGENNLYDKRLYYFVTLAAALPKDRQDYAGFSRLFGFNSDRLAKVDVPLTQTLDPAKLNIDRLDLPPQVRGKDLGADFTALGLTKRMARPPR
jgi:hypothetical protein